MTTPMQVTLATPGHLHVVRPDYRVSIKADGSQWAYSATVAGAGQTAGLVGDRAEAADAVAGWCRCQFHSVAEKPARESLARVLTTAREWGGKW